MAFRVADRSMAGTFLCHGGNVPVPGNVATFGNVPDPTGVATCTGTFPKGNASGIVQSVVHTTGWSSYSRATAGFHRCYGASRCSPCCLVWRAGFRTGDVTTREIQDFQIKTRNPAKPNVTTSSRRPLTERGALPRTARRSAGATDRSA